jgi:hypothetical protein
VAYVIVAVLLVVPIILFRRYAKAHRDEFAEEQQQPSQGNGDSTNAQSEAGQQESE